MNASSPQLLECLAAFEAAERSALVSVEAFDIESCCRSHVAPCQQYRWWWIESKRPTMSLRLRACPSLWNPSVHVIDESVFSCPVQASKSWEAGYCRTRHRSTLLFLKGGAHSRPATPTVFAIVCDSNDVVGFSDTCLGCHLVWHALLTPNHPCSIRHKRARFLDLQTQLDSGLAVTKQPPERTLRFKTYPVSDMCLYGMRRQPHSQMRYQSTS